MSSSIDKTNSSCKCSCIQQDRQQNKKRENGLNGCTTRLLNRPARVPLLWLCNWMLLHEGAALPNCMRAQKGRAPVLLSFPQRGRPRVVRTTPDTSWSLWVWYYTIRVQICIMILSLYKYSIHVSSYSYEYDYSTYTVDTVLVSLYSLQHCSILVLYFTVCSIYSKLRAEYLYKYYSLYTCSPVLNTRNSHNVCN